MEIAEMKHNSPSRPKPLMIGHHFATGGPGSLRWRGLGVFDQGVVNAAGRVEPAFVSRDPNPLDRSMDRLLAAMD